MAIIDVSAILEGTSNASAASGIKFSVSAVLHGTSVNGSDRKQAPVAVKEKPQGEQG